MSDRKIQNLFRFYADEIRSSPQPLKNLKAISAITQCRTGELGTTFFACSKKHETITQHHSCRHRSCVLCSAKSRFDWIEKEKQRLFQVPHFHVVFTLPHEYLSLWRFNEALFANILFSASQASLFELLADARYHHLTPGLLSVLHTWGRQLTLHPHIHCLVTAGGIDSSGEWKDIEQFLLPIQVLKAVYRGKVQALLNQALQQGLLLLPSNMSRQQFAALQRQTYQKAWSVRIEQRYEHGKGVALYLSRYLKGGPVHPAQVQPNGRHGICLRYLDHRDKRIKPLHLSAQAFLRRLLDHVPPIGLHTVRHYGLYAPAHKALRLPTVQALRSQSHHTRSPVTPQRDVILFCKICGDRAKPYMHRWNDQKAFSINKVLTIENVQQGVQADIANQRLRRLSRENSG